MVSTRKDINEILERWRKKGKSQLSKVDGSKLSAEAQTRIEGGAQQSSEGETAAPAPLVPAEVPTLLEVVPSGIEKLDELLMNGIPVGYSILVQGTPGSGFELFAKQFAHAGVGSENVVYYATNESADEVIATMYHFRWTPNITIVDIFSQYYEKVLQRELEIARLQREGLTISDISRFEDEKTFPGDEFEIVNFLDELLYDATSLEPPFRIIIDSVDFLFEHYDESEVLAGIRSLKAYVQNKKGTMLVTSVKGSVDQRIESALHATFDIIIELEITRVASTFESRLIIRKVRNRPDKNAILYYAITEKGITPEMVMRVA